MGALPIWAIAGLSTGATAVSMYSQKVQGEKLQQSNEQALIANEAMIKQAQEDKNRETEMRLSEEQRKRLRDTSTAVANSAYSGVAGISRERAINNVLFQSTLNEDTIKAQGETALSNIATQGSQQNMQIVSNINQAKTNTPSFLGIALNSAMAGAKTFAMSTAVGAGGNNELPDYISRLVGGK